MPVDLEQVLVNTPVGWLTKGHELAVIEWETVLADRITARDVLGKVFATFHFLNLRDPPACPLDERVNVMVADEYRSCDCALCGRTVSLILHATLIERF